MNQKSRGKNYVLGYDLGESFSQLSFMELSEGSPRTLSVMMGAEIYDIPTVLARREDVNQWFFGREAMRLCETESAIKVDRLIESARKGESVKVGTTDYDPISLLALFVKRSFSLLSMEVDAGSIRAIMFTTALMDDRMVEILRAVVKALSLPLKHVYFESYAESLFHYTMASDRELRQHSVLALDYHYDVLRAYLLGFNFHMTPVVATVDEKTYENLEINTDGLPEDPEKRDKVLSMLDEELLKISKELITGKVVSCVYLLGNGFKSGWMNRSLEFLCSTRKVFQGSNLFSKGATYAAAMKLKKASAPATYMLLDDEKLTYNIGLNVLDKGSERYIDILEGGRNWYDVKGSADVILESGSSFMIRVLPLIGGEQKDIVFTLEGLPEREVRTTALSVKMEMSSRTCLQVSVKDLGFGAYAAPSAFSLVKEFTL